MKSLLRRTFQRSWCLLSHFKYKIQRFEHLNQPVFNSSYRVFPKEVLLSKMPPKRKGTAQKAKENPVPVEEVEPEEVPKKKTRKAASGKIIVEEVEPEEVSKKKTRKTATDKSKVEEVEPEEVLKKKTRKAATDKSKAEEVEPEEVPKKKTRKTATDKSKVEEVEPEEVLKKKTRKAATGKSKVEEVEPEEVPKKKTRKAATDKKSKVEEITASEPEDVAEKKGRKAADTKTKSDVIKAKKPSVKKGKSKEKAKKDDNKPEKEDKVPLNKITTDWETIDFSCTKKNEEGMSHNLIISCWNVGGLKSWVKKDCLKFLDYETPDILCVQETKCSEEKLPDELKELELYKQYWCSSEKEGYAGVGIFTIKEPINVSYGIDNPELDEDGRCITAEYNEFYLVCVYVPNAGRKLVTLPKRLEWNKAFKNYIKDLDSKKPVIICGDMNVAHNEIDLARPQNNQKNAGFTPEEREDMTDFLGSGYVDTFRKLYPEKTDVYTFWTYMANARAKNLGWRLDYYILSERIMKKVCDNVIRTEVVGSDHCPITLFININAERPRSTTQ